jgi:hypothetical protein
MRAFLVMGKLIMECNSKDESVQVKIYKMMMTLVKKRRVVGSGEKNLFKLYYFFK